MITHIKNKNEFDQFISEGVVLIDFYATWCGPCRMMAPVLEDIDEEMNGQIKIGKLDVDEVGDVAGQYMISSIPTLMFFKDGKHVGTQVGYIPNKSLKKLIEKYI